MKRASRSEHFLRRIVTFPTTIALAGVAILVLPMALVVAATIDTLTRRRTSAVGFALFFASLLVFEVCAIVLGVCLFFVGDLDKRRELAFRFQLRWVSGLWKVAETVYQLRLTVVDQEAARQGPFVLLVRHSSIGDVVLAVIGVQIPFNHELRYVLKNELQTDPALDLFGQHLGDIFVAREKSDAALELQRQLDGVDSRCGVLIYPEGTRFTVARRKRALEAIASSESDFFDRATSLTHVLPPKHRGVMSILRARPNDDVVVLAHRGLDGITTLFDMINGNLKRRHIEVKLKRYTRQSITSLDDERAFRMWLYGVWSDVDAFVRTGNTYVS